MSSRALRKLQEQKKEKEEEENIHDNEIEINVMKKKKKNKVKAQPGNLYDVLSTENGDDDEKDDDGDKDEDIKEENNEGISAPVNKRRNKKKKKGKLKEEKTVEDDGLDEIDRSVKEVNKILGIEVTSSVKLKDSSNNVLSVFSSKSILAVDARNLNPTNEMKKKFGANVIQQEKRRNPHERKSKRTTSLVTPRDNWPAFNKVGLTMSPVKNKNSVFMFEHQEAYQKVQFLFYDAVESMDHNNIMALLNAHPYHIDSLLQLSEICKMNEDFQMAAEFIERALYIFECSFHTMFNISQANCKLEYKRAENRPFFLALFRHINYIGERGCYRTALEFCKGLLGLDSSEDPLCVLLLMDYYAIKAEQYPFFIQLFDEFEITKNVSLLPNCAFAYALANFHSGRQEESDNALRKALISFPSLLVELMDKCGISLDDQIKKHSFFDPVTYLTQSSSLNQLISLYVGRSYSLWKEPEVLNWLTENSMHIVNNIEEYKADVNAASERRQTRYMKPPRNVLRHIVISDVKEAMRTLPVEIRNQSIMTHDPLPPADSVVGYKRPGGRSRTAGRNDHLFSLFFQSLMPSFNQNADNQQQQEVVNQLQDQARALQEQEGGGYEALAGGAQRLMGAMRELLNTMTYRNDGAQGEQNNEEDAEWE